MKYVLSLITVFIIGCTINTNGNNQNTYLSSKYLGRLGKFHEVTKIKVDSIEYIVVTSYESTAITKHKDLRK